MSIDITCKKYSFWVSKRIETHLIVVRRRLTVSSQVQLLDDIEGSREHCVDLQNEEHNGYGQPDENGRVRGGFSHLEAVEKSRGGEDDLEQDVGGEEHGSEVVEAIHREEHDEGVDEEHQKSHLQEEKGFVEA